MTSAYLSRSYFHARSNQRVLWEVLSVKDIGNGVKNYTIKLQWVGTTTLCGKSFSCLRSRTVSIQSDNFNSNPQLLIEEDARIRDARVGIYFRNSNVYWSQ